MSDEGPPVQGKVARIVDGNEMLINKGMRDGVKVGMRFAVLDDKTMNVKDPDTGEDLGGILREKAPITIVSVAERVSLARRDNPTALPRISGEGPTGPRGYQSSLQSDLSRIAETTRSQRTDWPEGVQVGNFVAEKRVASIRGKSSS